MLKTHYQYLLQLIEFNIPLLQLEKWPLNVIKNIIAGSLTFNAQCDIDTSLFASSNKWKGSLTIDNKVQSIDFVKIYHL